MNQKLKFKATFLLKKLIVLKLSLQLYELIHAQSVVDLTTGTFIHYRVIPILLAWQFIEVHDSLSPRQAMTLRNQRVCVIVWRANVSAVPSFAFLGLLTKAHRIYSCPSESVSRIEHSTAEVEEVIWSQVIITSLGVLWVHASIHAIESGWNDPYLFKLTFDPDHTMIPGSVAS